MITKVRTKLEVFVKKEKSHLLGEYCMKLKRLNCMHSELPCTEILLKYDFTILFKKISVIL